MTDEATPPEHEESPGCCCNPTARDCCGPADGCGCSEAQSITGRRSIQPPRQDFNFKELSRRFANQPANFKEAEARGWPGPYVEYTEEDVRISETLLDLERKLFPEFFSDSEESD